jgi:hypothetical protein
MFFISRMDTDPNECTKLLMPDELVAKAAAAAGEEVEMAMALADDCEKGLAAGGDQNAPCSTAAAGDETHPDPDSTSTNAAESKPPSSYSSQIATIFFIWLFVVSGGVDMPRGTFQKCLAVASATIAAIFSCVVVHISAERDASFDSRLAAITMEFVDEHGQNRFDKIEAQLVDKDGKNRFDKIDDRFDKIDARFDNLEKFLINKLGPLPNSASEESKEPQVGDEENPRQPEIEALDQNSIPNQEEDVHHADELTSLQNRKKNGRL